MLNTRIAVFKTFRRNSCSSKNVEFSDTQDGELLRLMGAAKEQSVIEAPATTQNGFISGPPSRMLSAQLERCLAIINMDYLRRAIHVLIRAFAQHQGSR